ncbi:Crp/Fnr family transcriptional regulator [Halomonas sp. M20]|uniref:Crp/Fnr family transcriptional regulator n=1 Tax=Halomonas sp. M20 TaxID=2763264 RepID=UPI001D0A0911|nr:Crp/Fnr family transcriptional regulator [Halomonas sp. M20]
MDHYKSCVTQNLSHHIDLNDEDVRLLAELEEDPTNVKKHTELWETGRAAEKLYTLRSGWAFAFRRNEDGSRQVMDIYVPGDVLGIRDVTFEHHYTSACMLTDGIICPFPTERLHYIFGRSPKLAMGLHAAAARQQMIIMDRLVNVLSHDAKARIAHFTLEIYYRLKRIGADVENGYGLPITQKQISMLLGISEVHLSRTMSELEEMGLLRKTRKKLQVLDIDRLSELARFTPDRFNDELNPLLQTW